MQIKSDDLVIDLRDADEADLITADAQRLGIDQITADLPLKGVGRVVLCCRSGQRAWAAAEKLSWILVWIHFTDRGWRSKFYAKKRLKMKKYLIVLFCLLLSTPLQAQDRITLLLDWFINPDHGPIIIAQEKGYFADAGLEVEVIAPADPC